MSASSAPTGSASSASAPTGRSRRPPLPKGPPKPKDQRIVVRGTSHTRVNGAMVELVGILNIDHRNYKVEQFFLDAAIRGFKESSLDRGSTLSFDDIVKTHLINHRGRVYIYLDNGIKMAIFVVATRVTPEQFPYDDELATSQGVSILGTPAGVIYNDGILFNRVCLVYIDPTLTDEATKYLWMGRLLICALGLSHLLIVDTISSVGDFDLPRSYINYERFSFKQYGYLRGNKAYSDEAILALEPDTQYYAFCLYERGEVGVKGKKKKIVYKDPTAPTLPVVPDPSPTATATTTAAATGDDEEEKTSEDDPNPLQSFASEFPLSDVPFLTVNTDMNVDAATVPTPPSPTAPAASSTLDPIEELRKILRTPTLTASHSATAMPPISLTSSPVLSPAASPGLSPSTTPGTMAAIFTAHPLPQIDDISTTNTPIPVTTDDPGIKFDTDAYHYYPIWFKRNYEPRSQSGIMIDAVFNHLKKFFVDQGVNFRARFDRGKTGLICYGTPTKIEGYLFFDYVNLAGGDVNLPGVEIEIHETTGYFHFVRICLLKHKTNRVDVGNALRRLLFQNLDNLGKRKYLMEPLTEAEKDAIGVNKSFEYDDRYYRFYDKNNLIQTTARLKCHYCYPEVYGKPTKTIEE